jgi:hypothetical protein
VRDRAYSIPITQISIILISPIFQIPSGDTGVYLTFINEFTPFPICPKSFNISSFVAGLTQFSPSHFSLNTYNPTLTFFALIIG